MAKPNVPEIDWSGMWKNYSHWTRETRLRHADDLSLKEAEMARSGLKRGSDAWNMNIANIQKQQDKERKKLMGGSTASDLKDHYENQMKYYGIGRGFKKINLAESRRREAQASYDTELEYLQHSYRMDEGGRMWAGFDAEVAKLTSVEDRIASMEAQDEQDLRKGNWFTAEKVKVGHSDAGEIFRTNAKMTRAGIQELQRLATTKDPVFGRELKGWEAFAQMQLGSIKDRKISAADQSMETARKAASGQRSTKTGADAAAVEAQGGTSQASPWVKKEEEAWGLS